MCKLIKFWNVIKHFKSNTQTIKCLLIHPNPESALNEEAGRLLLEHYDDYEAHARLMTEIHALPSSAAKSGDRATTSGTHRLTEGVDSGPAMKKHAAEKLTEKKRKDKKRGLKRL